MNENQSLEKFDGGAVVPANTTPEDLVSALAGDLKRLTPDGRLRFYGAICQTVGLNPLTRPFDWLELQGKLILYANKGCAEQLRKIHKVDLVILERKVEFGVLLVCVSAIDGLGRKDESIGAVPFADSMAPMDKANAMMKAETKAKRRVSLSICGLGMLDESELDQVKKAHVSNVTDTIMGESAAAIADKIAQAGEVQKQPEAAKVVIVESPMVDVAATEPASKFETVAPTENKITPSDLEKEIMELEIVLSENPRSVDYIISQKELVKGAKLETINPNYRERIIKNPRGFHGAVKGWVKGGCK